MEGKARREQPDAVKRPFDTTQILFHLPYRFPLASTPRMRRDKQGDTIISKLKLKSRKVITPKGDKIITRCAVYIKYKVPRYSLGMTTQVWV